MDSTQQISVAEIATALGTENLVLRLVQLQRRVTELEALLQATTMPLDEFQAALETAPSKEPVKNGR